MLNVNGFDVETETEHREVIARQRERDAQAEAWQGVVCSKGCRGPVACSHVASMVEAIKRGEARRAL